MITPEQALVMYHAGPEAVVKVICELSRQVDLLQKRVEELERKVAQLSKNSSNSSKPPSSDITRPKPKKPKKGKRKIGAQHGHPKHDRPLFPEEDINQFHEYRLDSCLVCDNPELTFLDLPPRVIQQVELETLASHRGLKSSIRPLIFHDLFRFFVFFRSFSKVCLPEHMAENSFNRGFKKLAIPQARLKSPRILMPVGYRQNGPEASVLYAGVRLNLSVKVAANSLNRA